MKLQPQIADADLVIGYFLTPRVMWDHMCEMGGRGRTVFKLAEKTEEKWWTTIPFWCSTPSFSGSPFLVAPGYITYKWCIFNLGGKINAQWLNDPSVASKSVLSRTKPITILWPICGSSHQSNMLGLSCLNVNLATSFLNKQWWYTALFLLVPFHVFIMMA